MQTVYFVYNLPPDKEDKTCGYSSGHETTKGRCRDPYNDFVYTSNEYVPKLYERHEANHCSFLTLFNNKSIQAKTTTVDDIKKTNKKGVFVVGLRFDLIDEKKFNLLLSKIVNEDIINLVNRDKLLLVFYDATSLISGIRGFEYFISKLENFLSKNLVNIANTLLITNSNYKKCLYKTIPWDVQETAINLFLHEMNIDINYDKKLLNFTSVSCARFLLFNSKNRFHRFVITFKLYHGIKKFKNHFWFSLKKINFAYLIKLLNQPGSKEFLTTYNSIKKLFCFKPFLKTLPSSIEIEQPYPKGNLYRFIKPETFERTGIFVVTETSISTPPKNQIPMLTDKIYKAIAFKMPFILYGEPGSLKYLRQIGYKTFSDYWDESYDNILDPDKRADAIVKTVSKLSSLSDKEFLNLLFKIKDIVLYNYNRLKTRCTEKNFMESVVSFYQ